MYHRMRQLFLPLATLFQYVTKIMKNVVHLILTYIETLFRSCRLFSQYLPYGISERVREGCVAAVIYALHLWLVSLLLIEY